MMSRPSEPVQNSDSSDNEDDVSMVLDEEELLGADSDGSDYDPLDDELEEGSRSTPAVVEGRRSVVEESTKNANEGRPRKRPRIVELVESADVVRLRKAAKSVEPTLQEEADSLLQPLPGDYNWVKRLPTNVTVPSWSPYAENSPQTTPDHSGKSLTNLFLDMAQKPLNIMVECTNRYGRERFPKSWPTLTLPKAIVLIGLLFYFDENPRNNLKRYWSKRRPDKFVASSGSYLAFLPMENQSVTGISYRKFAKWYRHIRLYNPMEYSSSEKTRNKVYKVEKYLDTVQNSLQRMRHPSTRHLSLDEEMAEFKGRSGLVQIIKGKPRGQGLKYYSLCDPSTGYVYSAILHSGTYVLYQEVWGRIVAICFKLLNGDKEKDLECFLDRGFFIYTDRYYTTVHMNFAMAQRHTYFCGTLRREQRSHLPVDIMYGTKRNPASELVKNMKRGDVLRRYSNYGDTHAITWMDAMPVTYLSSLDDCDETSQHCYRIRKTSSGMAYSTALSQPNTGKLFAENMGGVDLHDQLISSVKKHHRSRRWYVSAVFLQTMDWFVANSGILYREYNNPKVTNAMLKLDLVEKLIDFGTSLEKREEPVAPLATPPAKYSVTEAGSHCTLPTAIDDSVVRLIRLDRTNRHHYCRIFSGGRRECQGHKQRVLTNVYCSDCAVFLCMKKGCFERFHELENYLLDDANLVNSAIGRTSQKY